MGMSSCNAGFLDQVAQAHLGRLAWESLEVVQMTALRANSSARISRSSRRSSQAGSWELSQRSGCIGQEEVTKRWRRALAERAAGVQGLLAGRERASGNRSDLGCAGCEKLATAGGRMSWHLAEVQAWEHDSIAEHGSVQEGQRPKWHLW